MIDVAAIETAINNLVASPQCDYRIGNKAVSKSDLIRQLMELRQNLAETPEVALEIVTFDGGIQLSGEDLTQFGIPS
jgi:hypothetical protein